MANKLYPKAREKMMTALLNLSTDTIKVILLSDAYTYSDSHEFLSDVSAARLGTDQTLASKTITALKQARAREGKRLAAMLQGHVGQLRDLATQAKPMIPKLVEQQRQRHTEDDRDREHRADQHQGPQHSRQQRASIRHRHSVVRRTRLTPWGCQCPRWCECGSSSPPRLRATQMPALPPPSCSRASPAISRS